MKGDDGRTAISTLKKRCHQRWLFGHRKIWVAKIVPRERSQVRFDQVKMVYIALMMLVVYKKAFGV